MHYQLKWLSLQKDASLIGVSSSKSRARDGFTVPFLASPFLVLISIPLDVLVML